MLFGCQARHPLPRDLDFAWGWHPSASCKDLVRRRYPPLQRCCGPLAAKAACPKPSQRERKKVPGSEGSRGSCGRNRANRDRAGEGGGGSKWGEGRVLEAPRSYGPWTPCPGPIAAEPRPLHPGATAAVPLNLLSPAAPPVLFEARGGANALVAVCFCLGSGSGGLKCPDGRRGVRRSVHTAPNSIWQANSQRRSRNAFVTEVSAGRRLQSVALWLVTWCLCLQPCRRLSCWQWPPARRERRGGSGLRRSGGGLGLPHLPHGCKALLPLGLDVLDLLQSVGPLITGRCQLSLGVVDELLQRGMRGRNSIRVLGLEREETRGRWGRLFRGQQRHL